jgi:hypothetical protein
MPTKMFPCFFKNLGAISFFLRRSTTWLDTLEVSEGKGASTILFQFLKEGSRQTSNQFFVVRLLKSEKRQELPRSCSTFSKRSLNRGRSFPDQNTFTTYMGRYRISLSQKVKNTSTWASKFHLDRDRIMKITFSNASMRKDP